MTIYTPELGNKICLSLTHGSSLVTVCKELDIDYSTVFDWIAKDKVFADNYAQAREIQADYHADQIIEIADNEQDSSKARNRIDARKWVAGKMKPKKYGDKVTTEHTGADGGAIEHSHAVRYIKPDGTNS